MNMASDDRGLPEGVLYGVPKGVIALRPGHAPSCSSAGSVVGLALVSAVVWAALVQSWASRLFEAEAPDDPQADPPPPTPDPSRPGEGPQARRWSPVPRGSSGRRGRRLRRERWGAVMRIEEEGATGLVFLDHDGAARALSAGAEVVGPDPSESPGDTPTAPNEAHLGLTGACPVRCTGCYTGAEPSGRPADAAGVAQSLRELAALGVMEVAFGGGEAGLDDSVLTLAEEARSLGLVPNLTTSGFGVTRARARAALGLFGQIHVSIDGLGPIYRQIRGWDGAALGLRALGLFAEAGHRVGVNTVLARPILDDPDALDTLGDTLVGAGAAEWQWLRFKPAGRGAGSWATLAPEAEQLDTVWPRLLRAEARTGLVMRIDCALLPFLVPHVPVARLVVMGVYGCEGGRSMWARGASGRWAPCSFALDPEGHEGGVSTSEPPVAARWRDDPALNTWRQATPSGACVGCDAWSVCRGGCHIVAGFLSGDTLGPDPQCPRVRAGAR